MHDEGGKSEESGELRHQSDARYPHIRLVLLFVDREKAKVHCSHPQPQAAESHRMRFHQGILKHLFCNGVAFSMHQLARGTRASSVATIESRGLI